MSSLVRKLQQAICDYDLEIESTTSASPSQTPFATWESVDAHSSVAVGQHWFEVGGKRAIHHQPITTALRAILGIPSGDPLRIASNLERLARSQVHTSLASWFAFDIIDNRVDIYALPNMKSMTAMMAAVANSGEASNCAVSFLFHTSANLSF